MNRKQHTCGTSAQHAILARCAFTLSVLLGCSVASAQAVKDYPAVDCVVQPHQIIDVGSPVAGVIEAVLVDRSDYVRAGQELARLDGRVEQATVKLAKARTKVDAQLESERINLEYDRKSQQRVDSLYGRRVISVGNKDEAERETQLSSLRVEQVKDLERVRQLELDRANELLRQKVIKSPIDGFVVNRYRTGGEFVEDQPILRIAQLDPLNIEAIVPMKYFGSIHPGMIAEVQPEIVSTGIREATVMVVDRIGDAASGTFGVRLEMPNPGFEIPAGLKCELRFQSPGIDFAVQPPMSTGQPAKIVEDHPAPAKPVTREAPEHSTELKSAARPAPQPATINTAANSRFVVGPISDEDDVEALLSSDGLLSIDGINITDRQIDTEEVITFMVITEALHQDGVRAELDAAGITNYMRLGDKPHGPHYSLGVFKTEARANKKSEQVEAAGIPTRIKQRVNKRARWWLELAANSDTQPQMLEQVRQYGFPVQAIKKPDSGN